MIFPSLKRRPLFRNRFGEYFFRSVVMEYFEGPVLGDTIVSMAFLLEENEDNLIDVDSIWLVQIREHGQLGNHPIRTDGYIVSGSSALSYEDEEFGRKEFIPFFFSFFPQNSTSFQRSLRNTSSVRSNTFS